MRKAPKLTTKVLNPGNCKQNVRTATAIFHEITAAAIQYYFPNKSSSVDFLKLFSKWWVFYKNNYPGNAAVTDDQKLSFLRATAEWVQAWQTERVLHNCEKFTLTAQTGSALVKTLSCIA